MLRAIRATIKLESSPPLSIAPSGTSLISRARTASSSCSEEHRSVFLFAEAGGCNFRERIFPVRLGLRSSVGDKESMAWEQLEDSVEWRRRPWYETERQVSVDRFIVQLGFYETAREQALELGRENDQIVPLRVIKGLNS